MEDSLQESWWDMPDKDNIVAHLEEDENGTTDDWERICFDWKSDPINEETFKETLHRSVGVLTFLNKQNKLEMGSGVIISRDVVLTSAHHIFERLTNSENREFKFYLGEDGEAEKYLCVERWRYPEEFKTCPPSLQQSYDYAIMKLKRPVNFRKYLELEFACTQCLLKNAKKLILQEQGFSDIYPLDHSALSHILKDTSKPLHPKIKVKINYRQRMALKARNRDQAKQFQMNYILSALSGKSSCQIVSQKSIAVYVSGDDLTLNVGWIVGTSFFFYVTKWMEELNVAPFWPSSSNVCSHVRPELQKMGYKFYVHAQSNLPYMANNFLRQIDHVHSPQIIRLDLRNNQLRQIDLSNLKYLTQLYLSKNQLEEINVKSNFNLTLLNLSYNHLQEADVRANINLTKLYLANNKLRYMEVSANINLTKLYLQNNHLKEIDVRANINLTKLYLQDNQLKEMNVRANVNLTKLYLSNNQLKKMDVTANINLTKLCLQNNSLKEIDVRTNVNLNGLYLSTNQLQDIDLRANVNLTGLFLSQNRITKINLTKNTKLRCMHLQKNRLSHVYLSIGEQVDGWTYVENGHISNQQSTACRVQLLYDGQGEAVREKAIRIVDYLMYRYSDNQNNLHNCAYSFMIF